MSRQTQLSFRHTRAGLKQLQSLPLEAKVRMSRLRIEAWLEYWDGECYVAFSGGKDSTVVRDLVHSVDPSIPCVFSDTGLEFPEIKEFVRATPGVTWVRPQMTYCEVVKKHGYPVVSKRYAGSIGKIQRNPGKSCHRYYTTGYGGVCVECATKLVGPSTIETEALPFDQWYCPNGHGSKGKFQRMAILPKKWRKLLDAPFKISEKCCNELKKSPFVKYERATGRVAIIGNMAGDSQDRMLQWLQYRCNMFDVKQPKSMPLSFWTEDDIWAYIRSRGLPYSSIYDMGYRRTGCVWCMFGVHMEKGENRFQTLRRTHPKLWAYCMDKMGLREVLRYIDVATGDDLLFVQEGPLECGNKAPS